MSKPYRVHIVVDPQYGALLRSLPAGEPGWVVDSPENHAVIEELWKQRPALNLPSSITSFKSDPQTKPDDGLIEILSTVDLHHGEYSHHPPYSILNIIGVEWSEKIQEELSAFGFIGHEPTREGFVVRRKLDCEPPESQAQ